MMIPLIRATSMRRLAVTAGLILFGVSGASARAQGVLVEAGQAKGTIVIADGTEKGRVLTAVQDLAGYIRQISGAQVPVLWDTDRSEGFRIFVGSTRQAPVSPAEVSEEKVGYDGFIIRSVPEGIVIAGRTPLGTANGVYYFAEEVLGVHWFSPEDDGPTFPSRRTIEIPTLDLTVKPDFAGRLQYQSWMDANAATDARAQHFYKNRDAWWTFNRAYGTDWELGHAFFHFAPASLFATHPEYFTYLDYTFETGTRNIVKAGREGTLPNWPFTVGRHHNGAADGMQRCLSNPGVQQLAIDWTAQHFATKSSVRYASLGANDDGWWCACAACRAMGATPSHQNLAFANIVARANEATHPDRGYTMLAYMNTIDPPVGMKAHRNVMPIVTPLWQCRIHSISSDCPDMVYLRRALTEWSKIGGGHLGFYDYISHGSFTFPGPMAMAEQIRFVRKLGGTNWLRENQYAPSVNWALLNWMELKLLWNTNHDEANLRREFIEGYYGKGAAPAIERIYDAIENGLRATVKDRQWPFGAGGGGLHGVDSDELLKPLIAKCQADVDAALKAAEAEPETFRLRIVRDMDKLQGKRAPEKE